MTATLASAQKEQSFLSEVFPLCSDPLKIFGFRLSPTTSKEEGFQLSFRLSRQFPNVVVVWSEGRFYALSAQNEEMPDTKAWQTALANVQHDLPEVGDRTWRLQPVMSPQITVAITAQLAEQILRVSRPFSSLLVKNEKGIEVRRRADFGSEVLQRADEPEEAALSISVSSKIVFQGTLAEFCANHPFRNKPEDLLLGLKVEDIESGSTATVVDIVGILGELREQLLRKASGSLSQQALKEAPDTQPVVGIMFGRASRTIYHYPLAALRPCITAQTVDAFDVDYGELSKATKVAHLDRQRLLQRYKSEADKVLCLYGFRLRKSINGIRDSPLFWQPSTPLDKVQLLFGNRVTSDSQRILSGLSRGGVYYRHRNYCSPDGTNASPIRITVLNLFRKETSVEPFIRELQQGFKKYKFNSILLSSDLSPVSLMSTQDAAARAHLDQLLEKLMVVPSDIYFVFLPDSDREADSSESGSLYHRIYQKLLRQGIASQFIYEDTLRSTPPRYLLNQIIPGDLAKLGNLPFVLAEPLNIADCFIGLDVARAAKQRLAGSMNACAGVCMYGNRGEFIRARTEGAVVEGEEIPQRFLEVLLPAASLRGRTVLIYRDGWFRGREIEHLLGWAQAIGSKFILVECIKSGVPRLYGWTYRNQETPKGIRRVDTQLASPDRGLALCLTDKSAIVATTKVSEKVGLARPLRLNVRPEGHQVHIYRVLDATLKLTLLHQGALKPPRLPMVLQGADRLANLRLNGVFIPECDRQFWY